MTAEEKLLFRFRYPDAEKLRQYGFRETEYGWAYETSILNGEFRLIVTVSGEQLQTEVLDIADGSPYVLHQVPGAAGAFVAAVREAHKCVLQDIAEQCFMLDVFRSSSAKAVLRYARDTYGDALEHLWPKVPENAVLRRKDTGKWYAAFLIISRRKLGMDSDTPVEILDLRIRPEELSAVLAEEGCFPGFHMNKRHWYSVLLDGSVPEEKLYSWLRHSYELAVK